MSPNVIGLFIGSAIGVIGYFLLRWLAGYAEARARTPEQRRIGGVFRVFAYAALVLGPLKGYFVTPMVLGY